MGCKADGAAQGYTVLGGIVLAYFAIQMIIGGFNTFSGGDINGLFVLIQGIALILMVVLSFDASGFVSWKVGKSGGRWENPEPFLLFSGSYQSS
jgi:small neutral amino acid transporter SnatA (MarC family)